MKAYVALHLLIVGTVLFVLAMLWTARGIVWACGRCLGWRWKPRRTATRQAEGPSRAEIINGINRKLEAEKKELEAIADKPTREAAIRYAEQQARADIRRALER